MAGFAIDAFYVTALAKGVYGVRDESISPDPFVVLTNGELLSGFYPQRELIIRFKVAYRSGEHYR